MDYDKQPIEVHTAYSMDDVKTAQKVMFRPVRIAILVLTVVFAVFTVALLARAWDRGPELAFMACMAPLVMTGAMAVIYFIFGGALYSRRQYEKAVKGIESGADFIFRASDVEVRNSRASVGARTEYAALDRVVETGEAFYLYLNGLQFLIIDKNGFRSGAPEELRTLLQGALTEKRYKTIK